MMERKLGKLAPKHDDRTLEFARYATSALPAPPASLKYSAKVPAWPMFANDKLGNCTCATVGHMVETWTGNLNSLWVPTVKEVTDLYWATGKDDTGRYSLDILNYWRNTGFGLKKDKITAFMSVKPSNKLEVRQASWLFGGLFLGIAMPVSAQSQSIWRVSSGADGAPGSWGGHAVPVVDYNSLYVTVVTWGMLQKMTWGFFAKYVDESFAVLSNDWFAAGGNRLSPSGFNVAQLQTDLAAL